MRSLSVRPSSTDKAGEVVMDGGEDKPMSSIMLLSVKALDGTCRGVSGNPVSLDEKGYI